MKDLGQRMSNRNHNHRLLGAIVLLSLAVIFLPMLFGQRHDVEQPPEGGIIPRPDEELETIVFQLNDDKLFQRVAPLPEEQTPAMGQASGEEEETAPPAPGRTPVPDQRQSAAPVADEPLVTWMVQLGSFSKENNARALRDRLRAKQYSAHLDRVSGAKGDIWRVRVGPELSAERARKLLQALEQETGLKGLVIKRQ